MPPQSRSREQNDEGRWHSAIFGLQLWQFLGALVLEGYMILGMFLLHCLFKAVCEPLQPLDGYKNSLPSFSIKIDAKQQSFHLIHITQLLHAHPNLERNVALDAGIAISEQIPVQRASEDGLRVAAVCIYCDYLRSGKE
jgi:hypothetical protein